VKKKLLVELSLISFYAKKQKSLFCECHHNINVEKLKIVAKMQPAAHEKAAGCISQQIAG
jgi:hypothetical protein